MRSTSAILILVFVLASALASWRPELFLFVYSWPGGDKTGHFLLMGALSFAVVTGFSRARFRGRPIGVTRCGVALLILVIAEELAQNVLPNRQPSLKDLLASISGVLVFTALGWVTMKIAASRAKSRDAHGSE